MSNKKTIHDRFRSLASFLCGYLSIEKEKSESEEWKQDLAGILRRYADLSNPIVLSDCKKCNTTVELEYLQEDEADGSGGYYYCPKCGANYYDQSGSSYTEMDNYQAMQEEDRIERQVESRLEMASGCKCGAYQINGMEVYQSADCCCGAG